MFKSVIFDMDGVLVNTESIHFRMYQEFFRELGMELSYEIYAPCIGSTTERLRGILLDVYGVDIRAEENWARIREHEAAIIARDGYGEIPGIREFILDLKNHGIRLAVASSSYYELIIRTLKAVGLYEYFDKIVSGADVKHPKPAPDVFQKAMKELGVKPEECVIVEDSANGVRAAKAAGAACMGFYNPDSGNQDLSLADIIVEGFEEVDWAFAGKVHHRAFRIPVTLADDVPLAQEGDVRLRLREMKKEDFEAVHSMYGEPEALRYMPSFFSGEDHRAFFNSYVDHMYQFYDFGMYVLEHPVTGELIGHVGLDVTETGTGNASVCLGYLIRRPWQGRGLAFLASLRVLQYARDTLKLSRVEICVHPENQASLAVAAKLSGAFGDFVFLAKSQ